MAANTGRRMPAKATKAAPKAAPAVEAVEVDMVHERDTKGTFVYRAVADDANVTQLYIKKAAFPGGAPASITVTITSN